MHFGQIAKRSIWGILASKISELRFRQYGRRRILSWWWTWWLVATRLNWLRCLVTENVQIDDVKRKTPIKQSNKDSAQCFSNKRIRFEIEIEILKQISSLPQTKRRREEYFRVRVGGSQKHFVDDQQGLYLLPCNCCKPRHHSHLWRRGLCRLGLCWLFRSTSGRVSSTAASSLRFVFIISRTPLPKDDRVPVTTQGQSNYLSTPVCS